MAHHHHPHALAICRSGHAKVDVWPPQRCWRRATLLSLSQYSVNKRCCVCIYLAFCPIDRRSRRCRGDITEFHVGVMPPFVVTAVAAAYPSVDKETSVAHTSECIAHDTPQFKCCCQRLLSTSGGERDNRPDQIFNAENHGGMLQKSVPCVAIGIVYIYRQTLRVWFLLCSICMRKFKRSCKTTGGKITS